MKNLYSPDKAHPVANNENKNHIQSTDFMNNTAIQHNVTTGP